MIVYFSVLLLIGAVSLTSLFIGYRWRWVFGVAAASFLWLFVGLRDRVGTDWDTYDLIFQIYRRSTFVGAYLHVPTEPAYALINYFAASVGGDIHLVNLICAAFMIAGIFLFSKLVRLDPSLVLLLSTPYLIFVVGMGYTRQSVAIGFGLAAIGYLANDRGRMFNLCAFLAVLFHFSAIFLFLFAWINSRRRALIVLTVLSIASPLILLTLRSSRYWVYLSSASQLQSNGVWFRLGIEVMGAIAIYWQRRKWNRDVRLYGLLQRATYFLAAFLLIAPFASTFSDRFGLYLVFIYLVGFGKIIQYSQRESRNLALVATYGISCIVFVVWFTFSVYAVSSWLPYRAAISSP